MGLKYTGELLAVTIETKTWDGESYESRKLVCISEDGNVGEFIAGRDVQTGQLLAMRDAIGQGQRPHVEFKVAVSKSGKSLYCIEVVKADVPAPAGK